MDSTPHKWAPALTLLLLGFVWGSSFILMKIGLFARDESELFAPVDLASLRVAIAGITLLPISLFHVRRIPRDLWKWIAGVGIIGSFIPAMLFATAQLNLPSAMAGMLNALSPLWTLLIGIGLFGVSIKRNQWFGILIGMLGTIWLILVQSGWQLQQETSIESVEQLFAIGLLVIATLCYGISVNITREKLQTIPSRAIAACSLGLVAIPALAITLSSEVPTLIIEHPDGLRGFLAVFVLAAVGTAGALVLFNHLIAWTNAVVAASVTYIIPLFAVLWGWLDGESLTFQHLLAGSCILLGVWITHERKKST
ncbi:MAG: EamA family transporter [Bacteroidetes bacterium]|nr:EamA family transporter [Bacteroidota bacterium]